MIRTSHRSRLSVAGILCLLIASFAALPLARAQFTGPGVLSGNTVNRPTVVTTDPAVLQPSVNDLKLGPGDQITIKVFGPVDYSPQVRLALDGSVDLPLIGVVFLNDLSLREASQLIAEKLRTGGFYRDPQVSITLNDSPRENAVVTGELHAVVPMLSPKRLFDVLALAGGMPATASHVISINRPGVEQPIIVDLGTDPLTSAKSDILILPGDTIVLSRVGQIYVLGAFGHQGIINLPQNTPLTLMEVTSLSGGYQFAGRLNDLRVIRTFGVKRTVVEFNIKRILAGKDPDPILQADDIVFLPTSPLKSALASGQIANIFSYVSLVFVLLSQIKNGY